MSVNRRGGVGDKVPSEGQSSQTLEGYNQCEATRYYASCQFPADRFPQDTESVWGRNASFLVADNGQESSLTIPHVAAHEIFLPLHCSTKKRPRFLLFLHLHWPRVRKASERERRKTKEEHKKK